MDRRELLKSIVILTSGTLIGGDVLLSSFTNPDRKTAGILSLNQVNLLNEMGETILPTTAKSKGAKAANVGALINVIITDCYKKNEQTIILTGLEQIDIAALKSMRKPFLTAGKLERLEFLTKIDQEAYDHQKEKRAKESEIKTSDSKSIPTENHYFINIKQLILWAYFNSEIGATEGLRFISVPTRFDGCVPYQKGDRSWY